MRGSVLSLGAVFTFALFACKSGSSGNGQLEVFRSYKPAAASEERASVKVGSAFAIPKPSGDGNLYTFRIFNDGVKGATCATEPQYDKPVGGNNWAFTLELDATAAPLKPGDKNKVYPSATAQFFFVGSVDPYKSSPFGVAPIDNDKTKVTIVSVDKDSIQVKVDAADSDASLRGEFTAKICPP